MIVLMDMISLTVLLGLLGAAIGSFLGATVWRLRARQLSADRLAGQTYSKQEYRQLQSISRGMFGISDRSHCLHCGRILAWYDLLPIMSWASTRGKCRYCHKSIGWLEPIIEIGTALFFMMSLWLWPFGYGSGGLIALFAVWLVIGIGLIVLFAYDAKWLLLPDTIMIPVIILSALFAGGVVITQGGVFDLGWLGSLLGSVAILSGIYWLLWVISRGAWIGFGDVKLGLALGLILGEWQLAFIALFVANLVGCIIILPGLLTGRLSRRTRVPFGPLLMIGMLTALWWGNDILAYFIGIST